MIDILISVKEISIIDEYSHCFEKNGYICTGEYGISGRRFYTKDIFSKRCFHTHIFQDKDPQLKRHLHFRDYMIAHPQEAKKYGELKSNLAKKYPNDIENYCKGKDYFIKQIDENAKTWKKIYY